MNMLQLGRTGIEVSDWCLGTMTYSRQTDQDDAFRQMDMALEAGINFFDVAEMYPVNPVLKETMGDSEKVLGNWFAKSGRRSDVVVASKICGDSGFRPGGYNGKSFEEALDVTLSRLQTDYIDLFQLHWPNRGSYHFRQNWGFDPSKQDAAKVEANMIETLEAADRAVKAGKMRALGLSNESAWGTMKWVTLAEKHGLPRMASIQNEYSLLCRLFDTDMSEVSLHEDVTLLSYSPLAAGLLTGKYQNGAVPEGSRLSLNGDLGGRKTDRAFAATQAYLDLAAKHGIDPVHMAMAWQRRRPFPISAIFGATSAEQLAHLLAGDQVSLSDEVMKEIDTIHRQHPMPY
ncbi:MAG: aldo/keto reductase [Marivivens sp.]|jgi:aryl-alcohol dehydrogenase-like predicted oxidoreductase|nr:aldo/keto reductase [Marivivens sp.]NBX09068.1 aldo/keto reductase [Marivivens sp.]NCW68478.1 aldo/keto reductase [Marivivens sp.]NDH03889.1 aldo/keto reductase [Marivivens sp.]